MFDAQLGRFHSADPLAELFSSQSAYVYAINNPVNFIDYLGMGPEKYGADGLTTDQWIQSSRPGADPGLGKYFRNFNRMIESEKKNNGLQEDKQGNYYYLKNVGYKTKDKNHFFNGKSWKEAGPAFGFYEKKVPLFAAGQGGLPGWATDVNTGIGAFNATNGLKSELFEYAVRSNYKSARTWSEFNNLRSSQQVWRTTNTLGKTGASYLKYAKGLGYVGAGLTTAYSVTSAYNYYNNGGSDWSVYTKSGIDVIMTGVGFLGPIGFGISATYFILDATTGGFGGFGQIKP